MRLSKSRTVLVLCFLMCTLFDGGAAEAQIKQEPIDDESSKEPFEFTDNMESREPVAAVTSPKPVLHSQSELEPEAKSSTFEPEPAIKFDNIKAEDYGDVIELKNQPDDLDTEVIEQLVDRFLNTGSLANNNAPKFANPVAQALVGSSSYWNTDGLEVKSFIFFGLLTL
uniref:Secreted protein n=1 Tax=Angiostrongylus cantonensis TaxID=6313 RepID=A0A0K0D850_ANGCA